VTIWYIFPILVCLDQGKSGNHGTIPKRQHGKKHFLDLIEHNSEALGPTDFYIFSPKNLAKIMAFFAKTITSFAKI
jgi:hypothetical protein